MDRLIVEWAQSHGMPKPRNKREEREVRRLIAAQPLEYRPALDEHKRPGWGPQHDLDCCGNRLKEGT